MDHAPREGRTLGSNWSGLDGSAPALPLFSVDLGMLDEEGKPFVRQLLPHVGQILVMAAKFVGGGSIGRNPTLSGALAELLNLAHAQNSKWVTFRLTRATKKRSGSRLGDTRVIPRLGNETTGTAGSLHIPVRGGGSAGPFFWRTLSLSGIPLQPAVAGLPQVVGFIRQ